MKHLRNALLVCLFLTRAGYAVVIESTNLRFFPDPNIPPIGNYVATASLYPNDPTPGSLRYFNFDPTQGTLREVSGSLGGIQAFWYVVRPGDVLSAATIDAHQFPAINSLSPTTVGVSDFYLGAAVSSFAFNNQPQPFGYGWVHVELSFAGRPPGLPGVLKMTDSAIAYYDSGIIVGTLTEVVPEPASCILMAIAPMGLLLCLARRLNFWTEF